MQFSVHMGRIVCNAVQCAYGEDSVDTNVMQLLWAVHVHMGMYCGQCAFGQSVYGEDSIDNRWMATLVLMSKP